MSNEADVGGSDWFDATPERYFDYYPSGSRADLEFRLSRKVMLAARRWTTFIDEAVKARTGQPRARWQTLFTIAFADEDLTTLQLSDRIGVQWPTLVRTLNSLEADGMIERVDNPADGRSRLVRLLPPGLRMVEEIQPILDPNRHQVVAALSEDELVAATRLLDKILSGAMTAVPVSIPDGADQG